MSEERIVSGEAQDTDEQQFELSLRPKWLGEYIGQRKVKENLSIFIEAARRRGQSLDHVLLYGPPGIGKTTLRRSSPGRSNRKMAPGAARGRPCSETKRSQRAPTPPTTQLIDPPLTRRRRPSAARPRTETSTTDR